MRDSRFVFVDVDTQRDFLEPSGALFVPGSDEILQNLSRLTHFARERGIPILATACAHTLDEVDPEPFPPHCLVGTFGQERIDATHWPGSVVLKANHAIAPGSAVVPHLTLHKTRYDIFSRPDADAIIEIYGRNSPTFVVYGVATDYCVRAAVLGLCDRGHKVMVVVDAVRAIDVEREADQFREFIDRGAILTLTDDVVEP